MNNCTKILLNESKPGEQAKEIKRDKEDTIR